MRCYHGMDVWIETLIEDLRDELPVQLALPEAIMKAKTHQELSSLALLGQDFWTSAISQQQSSKPTVRSVYHTTVNAPKTTCAPTTATNSTNAATSAQKASSFSTTNHVNGLPSTTNAASAHGSVHSVKSTLSSTQVTRTMDSFQKVCETKTVTKTTQINGAIPNTTSSLKTSKASAEVGSYVNGALSSSVSSLPDPRPKQLTAGSGEVPVSNFNSSETSAFSTPTVTKPVMTQAPITQTYHKPRLSDKLSDYEDVWSPATGDAEVKNPFFRPIQNGSVTEDEIVSLVSDVEGLAPGFSMVNQGYHSDTASDKSEFVFHPGHKLPQQGVGNPRTHPHIKSAVHHQVATNKEVETERVEETQTVNLERIVPSGVKGKDEEVVFTFDLPTQTVNSLTQAGSLGRSRRAAPTTKAPPVPERHPAYSHPWVSATQPPEPAASGPSGAINVSDYLIDRKQDSYSAAAPRVPPQVPPRKESFNFRDNFAPKMTSFLPASSSSTTTTGVTSLSQQQETVVYAEPHKSRASITLKTASSTPKLSPTDSRKHPSEPAKVCTIGRSQSMKALAEELEKPISARAQSLPKEAGQTTSSTSKVVKSSTTVVQVTTVKVPVTVPEEGLTTAAPMRQEPASAASSLHGSPRHKPTPPPKPQKLSSPVRSAAPAMRPPPISQSFEENFFQPDVLRRLEEPTRPHIGKFPVYNSQSSLASFSDTSTVEDMISDVSPDLTLKPIKPLTIKNLQRISEYDNINHRLPGAPSSRRTVVSSAGTQYCQPWDSNLWDNLMSMPTPPPGTHPAQTPSDYQDAQSQRSDDDYSSVYYESESGRAHSDHLGSEICTSTFEWARENRTGGGGSGGEGTMSRVRDRVEPDLDDITAAAVSDDEGVEDDHDATHDSFSHRLMPLLSTPRIVGMRNRGSQCPGVEVRDFVFGMAQKSKTTFGIMVEEFIKCTIEGAETNPHVVVANVRQFMNGIKNYLVQHGEDELNQIIEAERTKLGSNEFLNIDAIIEGALHKCVVKPLKQHIYKLFVNEYKRNGNLQLLSDNIKYARTKTPAELGVKPGILPPQGASMEVIKHFISKMQKAYSPLKKLENLLGATSSIYNSIQSVPVPEVPDRVPGMSGRTVSGAVTPGADDFLPMFIYVLVQCGVVAAEIEADYMWGLLHPCLLTGEGGYHLTTLSSAVHVLKNLRETMETTFDPETDSTCLPSIGDLQGFMKIVIPNETNDSIITKTLPVRPNMTTREVCSMIAHKFRITNPQDYGLYVLVASIEDKLTENSNPQLIKKDLIINGQECVFAYKRNNAKFAWPKSFK